MTFRCFLCIVIAAIATVPALGQEPEAGRDEAARLLRELQAELEATKARIAQLEKQIQELAVLLGAEHPVAQARLDDEEHEFVSYPVYSGHDETNQLLKRVGYTTYHDSDHRIPLWVSYKVSKEWLDGPVSVPRERIRWRSDEELAGAGASDADYRNSGYSRGHMAMQAILRGRSEDCERQGFLFANAAPQLQSFNAGIWLQLENRVIAWAREYGQVWVVCGPVLIDDSKMLDGRVTVPIGFYKVVISETPTGMEAVAFFFLHETNGPSPSLKSRIVSIDRVETLTRLDFFAELPDALEDQIESAKGNMTFAPVVITRKPQSPRRTRAPPSRQRESTTGDVEDETPQTITVYATRTGSKYHRGSCRYLRKSKIPMSLKEAKKRYGACSVCRPPA